MRVYPSGRKAFVLSFRATGRKRLMTIGTYGAITLDQARTLAQKHLAKLAEGDDPLKEKRRAAHGKNIKDLCQTFIERHAKPHKKTWQEDERRINRHLIPAWGTLKIAALTRDDVGLLHYKIGTKEKAPYEANRTLRLVSKMYELAKAWGLLAENAANPAKRIAPYREIKRDRYVSPDELPKLAQAIDEAENVYIRFAIWLYLLTGLRKSELLTARWDQIDFTRKEIRLGDTKAGRIHYVPLSAAAVSFLHEIPKLKDNPHVFPGGVPGKYLVNINKPWATIRKAAGIEDVRLHDLRRTVGSWLAQAGNSLHLIGRVLNHSNQSTTAIYARFGQDNVRQALEQHADRIMGMAKKKPVADVVKLKK
jgi:integrase